jgi:hypothetical protein
MSRAFYLFFILQFAFAGIYTPKVNAQIIQTNRFEAEHKSSDHNFNIIPLNKEGLILTRESGKFEDNKKLWDIIQLDSTLNEIWSDKIKLNNRLDLVGYEYAPQQLYLLFRSGEAESNNFTLLHFSLATHQYSEYEIKHQIEFRLTHFTIVGSTAIFGGYAMKQPAVLLFSMAEKQLKVVPGFLLHDTELLDIRINLNSTFNVLLADRGKKETKRLLIRTYDETGALLLEDEMTLDKGKTPLTGITSALVKDEIIVIGTYGLGAAKLATGFYSAIIDPYKEQPIHYTELTQLEHFVDYLGEKKAAKVKKSAERQRERAKPPTFKNSIALIRIHETDKGFLLLSEVYHSSTSLNSSYWGGGYPYNMYGRPGYGGYGYSPYGYGYPYYNSRYSSGYPYSSSYNNSNNNYHNNEVRMLESVMVFFDEQAKPNWDESLKFNNVKYSGLEQASDFTETSKGIRIMYKRNGEILSKLSVPHDDHSLMDTVKVKLLNESDIIRNDSDQDGALRHWYKNNFYTWGYHTVKDKSKSQDPTRYVFYINKITAE